MPDTRYSRPNAAEKSSPPLTGSGMLYSRSPANRWLTALPTKSTTIPAVTERKGRTWSTCCASSSSTRSRLPRSSRERVPSERVRDVGDRLLGPDAVPGLVEGRRDDRDAELAG